MDDQRTCYICGRPATTFCEEQKMHVCDKHVLRKHKEAPPSFYEKPVARMPIVNKGRAR